MKFFQWLKSEFCRVFPVFLFFLISFNLINMTQGLMWKNKGIAPFSFISIFLAAGVVAKVLVVIDHLPLINAFSTKALVVRVLWKSFLYSLASLLARFLIRLLPFAIHQKGLEAGFEKFRQIVDMKEFLGIQLWYIWLFLIFIFIKELITATGIKRVQELLWHSKDL